MTPFKSGFIAIIGRPNVGKSTFMNFMLGHKISIISPKPQTTRNQIRGILTTDSEQIIFIDTPGIHKPKHELGSFMNDQAIHTLGEVDLVLLMVDGTQDFGSGDQFVLNLLNQIETPCMLVVNKMDLIKNKTKLLENIIQFQAMHPFIETFYISALEGTQIDLLTQSLINQLPEGPMYYPKDQVTDHPEHFIIAEMIREKVIILTKEEVPHSVAVVLDEMKTETDGLVHIRATIFVERTSQKKILIGKNGMMMKEIGTRARKDIVMLLGEKVFLELWVKVEEDWRNKKSQLRKLGYTIDH